MDLSGPQKAVLMLLSMDEAAATPILAELDADEVKRLCEAAAGLRAVPTNALEGVYNEFIQRSRKRSHGSSRMPGGSRARARSLAGSKRRCRFQTKSRGSECR